MVCEKCLSKLLKKKKKHTHRNLSSCVSRTGYIIIRDLVRGKKSLSLVKK